MISTNIRFIREWFSIDCGDVEEYECDDAAIDFGHDSDCLVIEAKSRLKENNMRVGIAINITSDVITELELFLTSARKRMEIEDV